MYLHKGNPWTRQLGMNPDSACLLLMNFAIRISYTVPDLPSPLIPEINSVIFMWIEIPESYETNQNFNQRWKLFQLLFEDRFLPTLTTVKKQLILYFNECTHYK
jgi:hypothetical protein